MRSRLGRPERAISVGAKPGDRQQKLELSVPIEDTSKSVALFGATDTHLRLIRAAFDVRLTARDGAIHLSGEPDAVRKAADTILVMQQRLRTGRELSGRDVEAVIAEASRAAATVAGDSLDALANGSRITPKTEGQKSYVEAMFQHTLTFCLGPAGTGKTYLAVAVAVTMLKRRQIGRIVLVRPAVEAGEKLGYLPGDIQAKVNPYLRPLLDALNDMMGFDQIKRLMENDIIEVIPLAFMRGRTLNRAVIILDEAQNATVSQMLMFMTRLGADSTMIIAGDDSQTDLGPGQRSGVQDAVKRLARVKDVAVIRLEHSDIVRHPLVQRIVQAYDTRDRS
ncbi:MAG: PhoH family protein [Phycisphaerales bacterium]|nr:PhoH family protein [Phycisphaerales bacterium]